MNRSGALKLSAILLVLVLCVSTIGIGLQLASKGTSTIKSVDASTEPTGDKPSDTRESVSTTTKTVLSADTITYGQSVTDTAKVTASKGDRVPTGTVDFQVKISEGSWNTYSSKVNLVDGSAVSAAYTPEASGTYYFRAVYAGNSDFYSSHSKDYEEKLTVLKASTITSTVLGVKEITLGSSVTDNATVAGLGGSFPVPAGTVTFMVKAPGGAFVQYGAIKTLDSKGKAVSDSYTPQVTGTFQFKAVYTPSNHNKLYQDSWSGAEDEPLTVNEPAAVPVDNGPVESTTTTVLSSDSIALGDFVYDTATVSMVGQQTPTGTITFEVMIPGSAVFVPYGVSGPVALDASGQAVSEEYTPELIGTYYFLAVYSGDANYKPGQSGVESEQLDVAKAPTSTVTTLFAGEGTFLLGDSLYDSAEVFALNGALPTPTGMVTFQVSADNGATWEIIGSPVDLVDGKAISDLFMPMAPGHYEFQAVYSGAANYEMSESLLGFEPLDVDIAPSMTTTMLFGPDPFMLGDSVYDYAEVIALNGELPTPTGTVDFQVSFNHGVWYTFDEGVTLVDGKATSKTYEPSQAGDYNFRAIYSGDDNFATSRSGAADEPLKVLKSENTQTTTTTTTYLGPCEIVLGQSVRDNATVTDAEGCPVSSGTVTFYVSADCGASWTMIGKGPVALDACGNAQSDWYMPLTAGDYLFKAVYNGDSNHQGSASDPCSERLMVDAAPSDNEPAMIPS